jgi:TIR domain
MTLRAFISYRRKDAFTVDSNLNPDSTVLDKLTAALRRSGFEEVFVDTDPRTGIDVGDDFEARIYQGIVDCDLFLAVIGKKWIEILEEKRTFGDRDGVAYEIRAAIRHEKEFMPLLIDGAQMLRLRELVKDIRKLYFQNGLPIESNSTVEVIQAKLRNPISKIVRGRRLASGWTWAYVIVGVMDYYLCAINPHVFGIWEFGRESWLNFALVWSGLFIWPIFFLPFVLLALYRPFSTFVECVANAIR